MKKFFISILFLFFSNSIFAQSSYSDFLEIKKLLNDKKKINYMRSKILNEFKPMSWKKIFQKFFIDEWNLILK